MQTIAFKPLRSNTLQKNLKINHENFSHSVACEQWNPSLCSQYPILDELKTGFGIFKIIGHKQYIHQTPEIDKWWHQQIANSSTPSKNPCLVTGKVAPYARLHQKIKVMARALNHRCNSYFFNEKAYESFGKNGTQGANAPAEGQTIARHYASALNALLNSKHKFILETQPLCFGLKHPPNLKTIFQE